MPAKYHIHVEPAADRFLSPKSYVGLERDGCLGCLECVKRQCIYDVFKQREYDPEQMRDSADSLCKNCLWCVQQCKRRLFSRQLNPDFAVMGDEYWTPKIIAALWSQASDGKVPVSGAGYTGPFCGLGFDQIWTDMSEIVRPTRDGIHGREYINTSADIGRKSRRLEFDKDGKLTNKSYPLVSVGLPVVVNLLPFGAVGAGLREAIRITAKELNILAIWDADKLVKHNWSTDTMGHMVPYIRADQAVKEYAELIKQVRAVEIDDGVKVLKRISEIKEVAEKAVVIVRLPLVPGAAKRAVELAEQKVETLHLFADYRGNELEEGDDWAKLSSAANPRFISEAVTEIHEALIQAGLRDAVTVVASGGIALAEHMAKIIICGADVSAVDIPVLLANQCRMCMNCRGDKPCPVEIDKVEVNWSRQRIVNLLGSWHAQMIEVLGAMGMREARRLRGELGRAMFFKDMERESFGPIFGRRKELTTKDTKITK
jgi:hypothetical protein